MIVLECAQRSEEWFQARLGIPTASHFNEIITAKTMKPSTSAFKYLCRCAAEHMTCESEHDQSSLYMQRGTKMEDAARTWYEYQADCDVQQVGLILDDDRTVACSPDGLVGEDGLLEIKVPGAKTHVAYLLRPEMLVAEYRTQVQGGLWLSERKWTDLVSYNPGIQSVLFRVERDEEFIEALACHVSAFVEQLRKALIGLGYMEPSTASD